MGTTTFAGIPLSSPVLDVASIRGRFPALERKQDGRPVAYFDGPGGTQVPVGVVKAMADYLFKHNANTHWRYPSTIETDAALAEARRTLADFLNGDPSEIAFGQNMTTLTFHLSRALGRAWGPGDEIVVTELDHHANVDPWKALARDRGVTIRTVRMRPETGQLDEADLAAAIAPGREARGDRGGVERARDDQRRRRGSAASPARPGRCRSSTPSTTRRTCCVDVRADRLRLPRLLPVQVLRPAPGRALGPPRADRRARRPEARARAGLVARAPGDRHAQPRGHRRRRRGRGLPRVALRDAGASRREALAAAFAELHRRGQKLLEKLWTGLARDRRRDRVRPAARRRPARRPSRSSLAGRTADEVAEALALRGLFLSSGDFYALTVVERLGHGQDGLVRAGAACYTTEDEVDRLLAAVAEVARADA